LILRVQEEDDAKRLKWAVSFASADLSALKGRSLLQLQTELGAFLGMTRKAKASGPAVAIRPPYPWDYTVAQFAALQRDTTRLLAGAVPAGRSRSVDRIEALARGTGTDVRGSDPISIKEEIFLDAMPVAAGKRRLRIGGSVRASFLLNLAVLVTGEAGNGIRTCPECGRLFVRKRRQLYCKSECTDRATWRNYPEEKKRRAREKQYAKEGWTVGARAKKES
jgi:hypothetical protein